MGKELTDGLRGLADFLDAHPDLPQPYGISVGVFSVGPDDVERLAREARPVTKYVSDSSFQLQKKFGKVELYYYWDRNQVCTSRVTGTVEVPEQVIPAHTREIVEWDCPKLLSDEGGTR